MPVWHVLWVVVVSSVDEDVGGIVGVVGVADGMSELSSAGRWSMLVLAHGRQVWPV